MSALTIRAATGDDARAVRALIFEVLQEYGLPPDPSGTDADIEGIETLYHARGGHFWVLEGDSGIVGSCALYRADAHLVELRKMYLHPSVRGQGWGKRLLALALETARSEGCREIRLETASVLREAIALYASHGFERVPRAPETPRCDQLWALALS